MLRIKKRSDDKAASVATRSRISVCRSRALLALAIAGIANQAAADGKLPYAAPIGQDVSAEELAKYFSIQPDGRGLPDGSGDVRTGRTVFNEKCAMCHGDQLQGIAATGAPALAGGRGKLKDVPAKKTVESYWPHATTLFDYIKRAMPFTQPGSLTNDEVYALCAYILAYDKIVPEDAVMNKSSLARVNMPNRDGFVPFDNAKILKFR